MHFTPSNGQTGFHWLKPEDAHIRDSKYLQGAPAKLTLTYICYAGPKYIFHLESQYTVTEVVRTQVAEGSMSTGKENSIIVVDDARKLDF
jgi:hypothetical protein